MNSRRWQCWARRGYLENGGQLEHAQTMAAHESPRTTKLYDRTKDRLTQSEVAIALPFKHDGRRRFNDMAIGQ